MNNEQIRAAQAVGIAILETIRDAGELGAPSGPMFAALQAQGCSLRQYSSLVAGLLKSGFATAEVDETDTPVLFHITDAGRALLQKVSSRAG